MPAPYRLIDMPPGEFSNMFDYPAINMAAAHNTLIQGVNAIIAHAPHVTENKVQPFMVFCLTLFGVIHHHHHVEETFYFDALEEKLGKGVLTTNMDEHATFVPKLEETKKWLEEVQAAKEKYDGRVCVEKINTFADLMVEHLEYEVPTLSREKIRAAFTEKELKALDAEFMKHALKNMDLYTNVPVVLACGNPVTPWFPPIPLPMKWATRWWFSRRQKEAWEFGTTDFYGNARLLPPITPSDQ
ncbi:hypothetical protein CPB84DRAFT_1844244 [Gymnopilus junonius]|uniref:Hemerythrin-like domain-containing protein n=1 Tax=Gymnopilus junonius TaxID=109634 RepID=A0A9P5TR70_GYMJU|nr:hypothetical protein CPB84DRAFT_1844244 [Gymnopilus junonius]